MIAPELRAPLAFVHPDPCAQFLSRRKFVCSCCDFAQDAMAQGRDDEAANYGAQRFGHLPSAFAIAARAWR
jgi:hypothetical protein